MIWVLIISVFLVGYVAGGTTMFLYVKRLLKPIAGRVGVALEAENNRRKASKYWFDR